jgi:hypothetical protein
VTIVGRCIRARGPVVQLDQSAEPTGIDRLQPREVNRLRRENRRLAVVAPGGTAAAVLMNLSGVQNRLVTYENRAAAAEVSGHWKGQKRVAGRPASQS